MAESFTCPYCQYEHEVFGGNLDPHHQIDELLDDSGPTIVECYECGKTLSVRSEAVWSFEVEIDETNELNEEVARG